MEALVAVGLASNVLQLIDFTAQLFHTYNELRDKATTSENNDHRLVAEHLILIAERISASSQAISQGVSIASPQEQALKPVADGCCDLSKRLLKRLETCGVKSSQTLSRLQRAKTVFKTIWSKKEVQGYVQRLENFRQELNFHVTLEVQNILKESQATQSSKDDITAVQGKIADLETSLRGLRLDLSNGISNAHDAISTSVNIFRNENAQLHARKAERDTQAFSSTHSQLEDLRQSMATVVNNTVTIQAFQQQLPQAIAEISVEGSSFQSRIVRQGPRPKDLRSMFHEVLRQYFNEYQEEAIGAAKKEIRGTIRSEFEKSRTTIYDGLREMEDSEMEDSIAESPRDHPLGAKSSIVPSSDLEYRRQHDGEPDSTPRARYHSKDNVSIVYRIDKTFRTRIGDIYLASSEMVYFRPSQPPRSVCDLRVHFTPSVHWLPSGCSIAYQKTLDTRGSPKFGFQLESHRVLHGELEDAWNDALSACDLEQVQDMLSRKIIFPSDRLSIGITLLVVSRPYTCLNSYGF
ncbi:hypothetical protein F5Y15DRAFT_378190 [Xylariaceae sp. FL0016]|nr:hypothetical protein F5Y15DRAFT_378190 [Xylariaceae sp. FL0016]